MGPVRDPRGVRSSFPGPAGLTLALGWSQWSTRWPTPRDRGDPARHSQRGRKMAETAVKEGGNNAPTTAETGAKEWGNNGATTPARPPLTELYRPRTWADVVGQDKVVGRIIALARRGLAGRAYWLSGQSGTGKTTLARLIAAEVADDFCTHEVDAAALTVAQLRELE